MGDFECNWTVCRQQRGGVLWSGCNEFICQKLI